jgi:hypothetical protein
MLLSLPYHKIHPLWLYIYVCVCEHDSFAYLWHHRSHLRALSSSSSSSTSSSQCNKYDEALSTVFHLLWNVCIMNVYCAFEFSSPFNVQANIICKRCENMMWTFPYERRTTHTSTSQTCLNRFTNSKLRLRNSDLCFAALIGTVSRYDTIENLEYFRYDVSLCLRWSGYVYYIDLLHHRLLGKTMGSLPVDDWTVWENMRVEKIGKHVNQQPNGLTIHL